MIKKIIFSNLVIYLLREMAYKFINKTSIIKSIFNILAKKYE